MSSPTSQTPLEKALSDLSRFTPLEQALYQLAEDIAQHFGSEGIYQGAKMIMERPIIREALNRGLISSQRLDGYRGPKLQIVHSRKS